MPHCPSLCSSGKGGGGHDCTRPADVLIAGWDRGNHAALDITVTSPLCPAILPDHSGAAANGAELRKLNANSTKCTERAGHVSPWLLKHLVIGVGRLRVFCLGWHPTCQLASPRTPELQWLPTYMDVTTSSW